MSALLFEYLNQTVQTAAAEVRYCLQYSNSVEYRESEALVYTSRPHPAHISSQQLISA